MFVDLDLDLDVDVDLDLDLDLDVDVDVDVGFVAVFDAFGAVLRVSFRNAWDIAVRSAITVSIRL